MNSILRVVTLIPLLAALLLFVSGGPSVRADDPIRGRSVARKPALDTAGGQGKSSDVAVLSLSADQTRYDTGETVVLRAALSKGHVAQVVGFDYRVVRIGGYDADGGRMVSFEPVNFRPIRSSDENVLESMAPTVLSKPLGEFPVADENWVNTPGERGVITRAVVKEPGIYLVSAVWSVRGQEVKLSSAPVVMTVFPAERK